MRKYYSAPLSVDYNLTMRCNLQCTHCNLNGGEDIVDEMTTEEICQVIDQLYDAGVMDLTFAGGEILCRDDWKEIVAHAANLGSWPIRLISNGLLWKEEDFAFVSKLPHVKVVVSCDGFDLPTYSILRKPHFGEITESEFQTLVQTIEKFVSYQIPFNLNIMVTQNTAQHFFSTIRYFKEKGVRNFLGIKFFSGGRGLEHLEEMEVPYPAWASFLDEVVRFKADEPDIHLEILVTCPWELYLPLLEKGYNVEDVYNIFHYKSPLLNHNYRRIRELGCQAGVSICTIFPDGSVFPCSVIPGDIHHLNCGNLREKSFQEIWQTSPVLTELRELSLQELQGACQECKYNSLCGGGCRARAFILKGELNQIDPLCPLHEGGVHHAAI